MLTIRKGGHTDLSHIYSAFDMDFDKRELLPKLAIHKGLLHGDLDLLQDADEEKFRIDNHLLVENALFTMITDMLKTAAAKGSANTVPMLARTHCGS